MLVKKQKSIDQLENVLDYDVLNFYLIVINFLALINLHPSLIKI
jgi:hypothetical protein